MFRVIRLFFYQEYKMKRKVLVLLAALLLLPLTGAFSFGVGLQFNGNAGAVFEPGPAITFKLDSVPLVFAVNWFIGDDTTTVGLTGDYWAINDRLGNLGSLGINWFFGFGFFANTVFADEFGINAGMRLPLGLNAFLAKGTFEPFIQVAPSFGLNFLPSFGLSDFFFPISAGFRIWFK